MNAEERQALREKHGRRWDNETPRGEYQCFECGRVEYPCDVVKLLDATESSCKHRGPDGSYFGWSEPENEMDYQYTYCPECGEKL